MKIEPFENIKFQCGKERVIVTGSISSYTVTYYVPSIINLSRVCTDPALLQQLLNLQEMISEGNLEYIRSLIDLVKDRLENIEG